MYEIILMTGGIQQLGWCTIDCKFTAEEGVGDSVDSYAYDGKRMKRWSHAPHAYGQSWTPGDVIGACLDADKGEIIFFRNGVSLGVAYNTVRVNTIGMAYFPGFSLSFGERSRINFGSQPFLYPVPDFKPIQQSPPPSQLAQARYLLECLGKIVSYYVGDSHVIL